MLHHGVQQQFALHQILALFAQCVPQFVVRLDQRAQFIAATRAQRDAEITVAVTRDAARQGAQQASHRLHGRMRQPSHRHHAHRHGDRTAQPRAVCPVGQRRRHCRRDHGSTNQEQREFAFEG